MGIRSEIGVSEFLFADTAVVVHVFLVAVFSERVVYANGTAFDSPPIHIFDSFFCVFNVSKGDEPESFVSVLTVVPYEHQVLNFPIVPKLAFDLALSSIKVQPKHTDTLARLIILLISTTRVLPLRVMLAAVLSTPRPPSVPTSRPPLLSAP